MLMVMMMIMIFSETRRIVHAVSTTSTRDLRAQKKKKQTKNEG